MRGAPDTPVTLWIERKGETGLMKFDLQRAVIRVSQVEYKLLDKGVGYVKVKQFSKGISSDVADALKDMSGRGATSWILDLRYNPGGLLEEAVQLSDLFVDSGTVVTTVSGRDREARRAERGFGDTSSSLVVLVNGGSASASEIVAGALKNLDRAVIVGTRTFGKGTVQELYDNEDRSKLKLTIAQYLTPGDRSIQNLGIVPDIQLQRMYIPDNNDAPSDFVRMLPPTHTYGEKDLDATLVSTYAKDNEKPAHEVPFLVERKKPAIGDTPQTAPPGDDDGPDEDEVVEDFEMRFAKDMLAGTSFASRPKLLASASKTILRVRAEEEKKLVTALATIGVDGAAAPAQQADNANLEVSIAATPGDAVKAGTDISITATVKNTGTGPAWRVLPRLQADDNVFQDVELPIGKVGPGETKTFVAKVKVPQDALDRVDRLGIEMREQRNAPSRVLPAEIKIEALPRPVFAYSWQLVDEGNGDGLVQRGEKYKLIVSVKNTGQGAAQEATAILRNATGDGVVLDKSRFEIKDLAPGQQKDIEFPLATDATLKADEVVLELIAYDANLDVQASDKLKFKVQAGVKGEPARGEVTTKQPVAIRAGAGEDSSIVGSATKGASYAVLGRFNGWVKVKLGQAGARVGFVPEASVAAGGSGSSAFAPFWHSTPPLITLQTKAADTGANTYRLQGTVSDETHVEDVYIFVDNKTSKIENRKVFYRSNRGGKDGKTVDFAADLPLWPGSNLVTIVARENADVRSVKYLYLYRDPPRTASTRP
jgi:carboxyl-terminal processing protease